MLVGNGAVNRVVSKVGQVQNNRLPLENTLIWNKITLVYPDISPTFIQRVFITKMLKKYYTKNWGIMINERTTEKYSVIYYGIIREGVKKMIRARISQTQKEFKEVQIKQKVSSLDQFGLGRIIENEMQFGEKIYENNKK